MKNARVETLGWPGLIMVVLAALPGCMAGPEFQQPLAVKGAGYGPVPVMSSGVDTDRQRFMLGSEVTEQWWSLFHSQEIDAAVALALSNSPTLDSARATLAQAQQLLVASRGSRYPQLDLDASASHNSGSGPTSQGRAGANLFSVGPLISYAPDVFGGRRRQTEQQAALTDVQRYELGAAYLALTGNVVMQSINIASARAQIDAVKAVIDADEKNLSMVSTAHQVGTASMLDVLGAKSQLASDKATLPALEQELSVAVDALTVLVGKTPAEWTPPSLELARLDLPTTLPVSLPAAFVHERPDILAAEAQLHAASAAIGVAEAQRYPDVSLTASWSLAAESGSALFSGGSSLTSLGAGITAPLFHGGALAAQQQAAVEAYNAQLGIYRQTVLQAFAQVADTLRALEHDGQGIDAQRTARDTAQAYLELSQASYKAGKSNYLQVLDAQRQFEKARQGYVKANCQRYLDSAQLFAAMGGAWKQWNQAATAH